MSQNQLEALLNILHPKTLACMVVDWEDAQEEWQYYPEEAPPAAVREELRQALALIVKMGTARAVAAGLDFQQLLEQIRDEQQAEDWPGERDRQERENWLKDFE